MSDFDLKLKYEHTLKASLGLIEEMYTAMCSSLPLVVAAGMQTIIKLPLQQGNWGATERQSINPYTHRTED